MRHLPAIAPVQRTDDLAGFGCLRGPHGALPLTAFNADLTVSGPVWRWALRQSFVSAPAAAPVWSSDRASIALSRRVATAPPPPPPVPTGLAKHLLDTLAPLAADRVRLALMLRAQRTMEGLRTLITSLEAHGPRKLLERLRTVRDRIAPPATMEAVADQWPELEAVLTAIAGAGPGDPAAPDKPARRGFRFWQ